MMSEFARKCERIALVVIAIVTVMFFIAPSGAVEFNNAVPSESCIAWSYTPNDGAAGSFTELILDGYVVHNLSLPDNPDHGYIILCGFPPNTCHRLDAANQSDARYYTNVTCTTGYDWDAKYLSLFIFLFWLSMLVLVELRMDVIYGIMNMVAAIFAYRNDVLMNYGTDPFTLDLVMVLISIYIIIMVFWEYLKRRAEGIRKQKEEKEKKY